MFIDPINVMTHHGRTISTIKGSTHQHQPCMMDPKSEFRLLVQSLHGKTKKACVYTRTHFAKVWRITYRVCCCDSCGAPCSLLWPWSDFSGHFRGNSVSIGHATTVSMQSLATVLSRVGLAVILDNFNSNSSCRGMTWESMEPWQGTSVINNKRVHQACETAFRQACCTFHCHSST